MSNVCCCYSNEEKKNPHYKNNEFRLKLLINNKINKQIGLILYNFNHAIFNMMICYTHIEKKNKNLSTFLHIN